MLSSKTIATTVTIEGGGDHNSFINTKRVVKQDTTSVTFHFDSASIFFLELKSAQNERHIMADLYQ